MNYNGLEHLKTFLPSVVRHCPDDIRLIVVDNASTDQSIEYLRADYQKLELLQFESNLGFAGGYNRALGQIEQEYCILLNSDVEVTENWTVPLLDMLDKYPAIAAVQPKVLSYKERSKFEHAGAAGGYMDGLCYAFCRGRVMNVLEEDRGQYDAPCLISWASGAAMALRRSLFLNMGGFDANYFAHFEEIDLCWRFQLAGYGIATQPASTVYHLGGGTLDYVSPRKMFLNFRNALYTIYKNEKRQKLWWKFPLRTLFDFLAFIHFANKGEFEYSRSVWTAHHAFYRHLKQLRQDKRRNEKLVEQQQIEGFGNDRIRYSGSLLWDFYIRGRRKFSEITKAHEIPDADSI